MNRAGDAALATLLDPSAVPMATLRERYGALLALVRAIIGVEPKCDEYLEIWPPAFRIYNIMVPNFLNLPFSVFGIGGAPADIVGLGLYVSSRVAECPYCAAHTCSFALRRGASPEKMAQALIADGEPFTPGELATIAVARSLARVPSELSAAERNALESCFSVEDAEWIVAGICMMGFLNKFMDTIGVELEASTAAEVASTMGMIWTGARAGRSLDANAPQKRPPPRDSLWTKLSLVPRIPSALRMDKRWQRGVPNAWPGVGVFLKEKLGHDFPVLSRLRHARVIQSIASMLRESFDPATTSMTLDVKILAGVVFATVVGDRALADDVSAMAPKYGVDLERLEAAARFAINADAEPPASDSRDRALLLLARAASPSPAAIDATVVATCRELAPAAIVELVTWLSVLQMLHRLASYFASA